MSLKHLIFTTLIMFSINSISQTNQSENEFEEEIDKNMIKELIKEKLLNDSLYITKNYLDKETGNFNKEGAEIFKKIQSNIHLSYFTDYLYLQHVEYENYIYALYYTMEGINNGIRDGWGVWRIVRFGKENWISNKKLNKEKVNSFNLIMSSQDIAPMLFTNPNSRIIVDRKYLILEIGKLYHSLYNLQTNEIILNEISPWQFSERESKKKRIEWIKLNLHDKITKIISE